MKTRLGFVAAFAALFAYACSSSDGAVPSPDGGASGLADAAADAPGPVVDGGGGADAKPDAAPIPRCSPTAPFMQIGSVAGAEGLTKGAALSADELEIFYVDGTTSLLMRAIRAARTMPFGAPAAVAEIAGALDNGVGLSRDGRTLYFAKVVTKGAGGPPFGTLFRAQRASATAAFAAPESLGVEYGAGRAIYPVPTAAQNAVYYTRIVGATPQVVRVALPGATAAGATVATAGQTMAWGSAVDDDDQTLYIGRLSPMGGGGPDELSTDVFRSAREVAGYGVATEVTVDPSATINIDGSSEIPVWLSPDRCRLYFTRAGVLHVADKPL